MDNFSFDITSNGHLAEALIIAFSNHRKATHFRVEPAGREIILNRYSDKEQTVKASVPRLVLGWHENMEGWHPAGTIKGGAHPLPFPLQIEDESALNFVKAWLLDQSYGPQPDHDGDNGKGFRIYNEGWGRIGGDFYAFVAIEPVWAMYGK